ncbi:integral membrane protein [Candidatus Omnitrophus magneticus]|uniref:Integral membrane protein n=1 Tax=Candidatus Omnitrophus magneticus TaxID=1609969 RepID=A0A0F0CU76_9BACT|nr:integral membrane protein [Candidatus Omnitrophus magneticus]
MWYAASFVWGLLILILSITPGDVLVKYVGNNADKAGHFVMYTIFALLLVGGRVFYQKQNSGEKQVYSLKDIHRAIKEKISLKFLISQLTRTNLFILILCGVYGIVIEFIQLFIPGRTSSALDALSNTAGVLLGIFLGKFLYGRNKTI